jgi:hypothetical protein
VVRQVGSYRFRTSSAKHQEERFCSILSVVHFRFVYLCLPLFSLPPLRFFPVSPAGNLFPRAPYFRGLTITTVYT